MTDELTSIITLLDQRKTAIEKALMALREIGDVAPPTATPASPATVGTSGRKGKKRTAAQRKRMAEAQRLRYANLRGESEPAAAPAPEPAAPKRKISAEGMENIIAAQKKRWRAKKAAAKSVPAKKTVVKKAAVKAPSAKATKKVAPVKKAAPASAVAKAGG